jgi:uncharacterized protein (DUF2267 family)
LNYAEFVQRVSEKAGLDRSRAEAVTQSVLSALGERLSQKEAGDLASQLARELKPMLLNVPGHGHPYTAREFVHLVAERLRTSDEEARRCVQAVLSTVGEAVDRGELRDVFSEAWRDPEYEELWVEPADATAAPGGSETASPAGEARTSYEDFLAAVQRRADLDRDLAEAFVEATLTTLAERITRGEAEDLAAELPPELRPWLEHTGAEAERFSAREFVRRVAHRVPVLNQRDVETAVSAVLVTLREAVSDKEVRDMFSQLPDDMLVLFSRQAAGQQG